MGIFPRLFQPFRLAVRRWLERVLPPERLLGRLVRSTEQALAEARRLAATAIATERRLRQEVERHRRALACREKHDALARELEARHAAARDTSEAVKAYWRSLEV